MTILVIGCDSFLAKKYLEYEYNSNLKIIGLNRNQLNLLDITSIYEKLEIIKPKYIINFVASNSENYRDDYLANVFATENLLQCVKSFDKNIRLLLIGSSAEYCIQKNKTYYSENDNLNSDKAYGKTKILQTYLMRDFVDKYCLNIIMARIFNVFGNSLSEKYYLGLLENKIKKISKNNSQENLLIYNVIRDFSHYNDIIKKLVKIINYGDAGEIYNVGSGIPKTMYQITEDFIQIYDYKRCSKNLVINIQDNICIPKVIVSDNTKFIKKFID
jgi:GDP-4-dehydro-6-deoxy-D-mannose reductase